MLPAGRAAFGAFFRQQGRKTAALSSSVQLLRRRFVTDSFINGETSSYVAAMYNKWKEDPKSVHASWSVFFDNVDQGMPCTSAFVPPPIPNEAFVTPPMRSDASPLSYHPQQTHYDTTRLIQLVHDYQQRGHIFATVDPLGLPKEQPFVTPLKAAAMKVPLGYRVAGFTESDLDRQFTCAVPGQAGFLSPERPPMRLRDLIRRLEETYCGTIGIEFAHIENSEIKNYLRQQLELPSPPRYDADFKKRILSRTARAHLFEVFCGQKFNTSKRFGVDGCETAIVALKGITKRAVQLGVNSLVIGMAHRGRLNTLVNVLHKPMRQMVAEFRGYTGFSATEWGRSGDVKYHLGQNYEHWDADAEQLIHLSVPANPSHLEAVDPVVLGQSRAKQYFQRDAERKSVLPILVHGDASFAGQGVVYESLQLSNVPGYTTGGCVHMVVNNQIGFTTNVADQGSGRYCSDLAKSVDAPVFHVNADDPEAVTRVSHLAIEFRQRFHRDVFINLVGYRRFGHNELDMPKFTQPAMYNKIAAHPNVLQVYSQRLMEEGVVDQAYLDQLRTDTLKFYNEQHALAVKQEEQQRGADGSKDAVGSQQREYAPQWRHMATPQKNCPPRQTGVPLSRLKQLGGELCTLPENFSPHPTISKIYKTRLEAIQSGTGVDFGLAEALACATLLNDGFHVRLSGQDVQRGTFSHRHAVVHDQSVFTTHTPLQQLGERHGWAPKFEVWNSPLSEYAVMGFELGYALENPDTLVVWEAQFGDFANGAQVIIDQFLAGGEVKWGQQCGLVLSLPHGFDGQGPEHSSARPERFLQLCDDREDVIHALEWDPDRRSVIQQHNLQVVCCSTPANYFHALRRQMHRGFRKPLVLFNSKRLLKMRAAFSRLSEFAENTRFLRYIPNHAAKEAERPDFIGVEYPLQPDPTVKRLVLCSGQVYYDLAAHREKTKRWDVAIARVEQISPFPFDRLCDDIRRYPNLQDIVWAQEETMNSGPWMYASRRIGTCLKHLGFPNGIQVPIFAGRDVCAAPATGDPKLHSYELEQLLSDSFNLDRKSNSWVNKYIACSGGDKKAAGTGSHHTHDRSTAAKTKGKAAA